jgi:hypothetical protein
LKHGKTRETVRIVRLIGDSQLKMLGLS